MCDILISKFTALLQRKGTEILMIYSDQDGMFREETEVLSGQRYSSDLQRARQMFEFEQAMMMMQ